MKTNMSFWPSGTVHYYAELGQCSVFSTTEAPEQFVGQVTILKYFSHYMEENLMDVSVLAWLKCDWSALGTVPIQSSFT